MSQTAQDFFRKGITFCEEGKFEDAIDLLDKAHDLDKGNTDVLYNRARAHFRLGNFEPAINDFTLLIAYQPKNAFYYSERGVAWHLSGENLKALQDLDKAASLEPQKPFRYSSRAFIKERLGDLRGALADYEKTIALDPEDAVAHNNKGLIEEKLGYLNNSKKSFAKADQLDPKKARTTSPEEAAPAFPGPKEKKDPPEAEKDSLTFGAYVSTWKQLLTSRREQKKFISFIKTLGRRKS